jgi:capsule polysaccharide export protein KpsE/RkpR
MTGQRNTMISGAEPYVELTERAPRPPRHEESALVNTVIYLWRERALLGRVTAIGGLLTLLIAFLIPNRYESSTRLMAPDKGASASEALMTGLLRGAGGSGGGGGLVGLGANLLGLDNSGAMVVGVLNSRSVADSLVKRFDLKKVYRDRWDKDAREDLADRTNIAQDRKSEIITVAVEDRDPARAAAMATAYVDELNRLLALVNTSSAHRERVFIEERLKVVKQELDKASTQLADFSTKTTTLDLKEQGKAMVGAVATLQGELIAYETQLSGLQQIYTASNVRVRSLQARVNELRHQLEQVRGSGVQPPPGAAESEEEIPSFRRLPALGVTYSDLYREVKIREAVFETLTQQYEMAKISEAKEIPTVKVLDPANLPEKKSGPPRLVITVLGVILSFAGCAMFVIGKATWKQVETDDPRKRLANEVLVDARPAYFRWQRRMSQMRNSFSRNHADRD